MIPDYPIGQYPPKRETAIPPNKDFPKLIHQKTLSKQLGIENIKSPSDQLDGKTSCSGTYRFAVEGSGDEGWLAAIHTS